jgi:hypothetical protein
LNRCKNECTDYEFSDSVYTAVVCLLDLYFSNKSIFRVNYL